MPASTHEPRPFRIFVSSPGDLGEERMICARVVDSLKPEFARMAQLEAILWEQEPLRADTGFQDQIALPSETDLVVILIWSRLGYRLHSKFKQAGDAEAPTGTIFEFRDAIDGRRRNPNQTPDVMVYRKTAEPPKPSISDKEKYLKTLEDWGRVEEFFNSSFFKDASNEGAFVGAYHTFQRGTEFKENFERHLRAMIVRRLGEQAAGIRTDWQHGSPFRGLAAFDFEHRDIFAGRSQAAWEVREALRRQAAAGRAFVLVTGLSGGGKSSLIRAGVLPDLVQPGVIEGIGLWRRVIFRPGAAVPGDLVEAFVTALATGDPAQGVGLPELMKDADALPALVRKVREHPSAAALLVEGALRLAAETDRVEQRERLGFRRADVAAKGQDDEVAEIDRQLARLQAPEARLVVFIDQFEELFSDTRISDEARAHFVAMLDGLAREGQTWVLATLRSDFFARCETLPGLRALKEGDGTFHLFPPSEAEIGQMIRQPARTAGLEYERDLRSKVGLDEVLREVSTRDPGALPLLQFTLDELYQRAAAAGRRVLTYADYEALGGLEGAVGRRAEEVFTEFVARDPRAAELLPGIFSALVRIAPDEGGSSRAVSASVPLARFAVAPGATELVQAFITARLLVAQRGKGTEAEVRVAHEALFQHWPRLKAWIEENTQFLVTRARLASAAQRWETEQRGEDFLLPKGRPLVEAEELLDRRRSDLAPGEIAFIAASSEARRRDERAAARRRRNVLVAVSTAALLALAFACVSLWQYRRADAAARRATLARNEAEKLIDFMGVDLRKKLVTIGRLELLDSASQRVRDYYRSFAAAAGAEVDSDIRARQAAALMNEGLIIRARGELPAAMKTFQEAESIQRTLLNAESNNAARALALSETENWIGRIAKAQGDLAAALACFRSSLTRRQALVAREPTKLEWTREVAESLTNIGNAQTAQGDLPAALKSYREALALDEKRVAAQPANTDWRHDLYSTQLYVGETLLVQGALAEAMSFCQAAAESARALLMVDAKNTIWQRDLAVALGRTAEAMALSSTGDPTAALARSREALEIHRRLARQDPSNLSWQNEFFAALLATGDALRALDDPRGALQEFRAAQTLQQTLAERDPTNAAWQRDLGTAHEKVGVALIELLDFTGAVTPLEESLRVRRSLTAQDPGNSEWRFEEFVSLSRLGDALAGSNRADEAEARYRSALAVVSPLAAGDATNADWSAGVAETEDKIGQLLEARSDLAGAIATYQRASSIAVRLCAAAPDDLGLTTLEATIHFHLARALLAQRPATDRAAGAAALDRAMAAADRLKKAGPLSKPRAELLRSLDALRNRFESGN